MQLAASAARLARQILAGARVGVLALAVLPIALGAPAARLLLHAETAIAAGAPSRPADDGNRRASLSAAALALHDEAGCGLCAAVRGVGHASATSASAVAPHALASQRAVRESGFAFTRDGHLHQPSTRAPPRSRA